jgi:hypothetical protein
MVVKTWADRFEVYFLFGLCTGMFGRACTAAVPVSLQKGSSSEDVLREVVGLREVSKNPCCAD